MFLYLLSLSYAQDSIDSHGLTLSASQQTIHDGLVTFRTSELESSKLSSSVFIEYAKRPLVLYTETDFLTTKTVLVDELSVLNLATSYNLSTNISLGLSTSFALEQATLGTTQGTLSVKLTEHIGLVPFIDLPGIGSDLLKYDKASGGGFLVASTELGKWSLSGNVGMKFASKLDFYNLNGDEKVLLRGLVSYAPTDSIGVRAEVISSMPLEDNLFPWTETPVEVLLSTQKDLSHNFGLIVGGSKALTVGATAANYRIFAGLNSQLGKKKETECPECQNAVVKIFSDGGSIIALNNGGIPGEEPIYLEDGSVLELAPGSYSLLDIQTIQLSPPPLVEIRGDEIYLLSPIYFDFDKSTIKFPDSTAVLDALVELLSTHQELLKIEVAGHTDVRGSEHYNNSLSQRRVNAVVEYLVGHGIANDRLLPIGYGETQLAAKDCKTEECHQLNRRVKFMILEKE